MDDFDAFARTHGPGLAQLAYLLCGNRATAEDLVQMSLLKLHKAWPKPSQVDYPAAYARQTLTREYVSWRRRRWTTEVVVDTADLVTDHDSVASDHAERIAQADVMWRELSGLPKKQRAVLVLRYYLDLADDEIAQAVGCTSATVRSHASRALQSLRSTSPKWKEDLSQ